jgi:hypothetical protein
MQDEIRNVDAAGHLKHPLLDAHQKLFGAGLPTEGFIVGNFTDGVRVLLAVVLEEKAVDAVAGLKGCHGQSSMPVQHRRNILTKFLPNSRRFGKNMQKTREKQAGVLGFEPSLSMLV